MELFGQFAPAVNSFVKIVNRLLPIELKNKNVVIEYNKILTEKMIEALKKGGVKLSNIGYNYNIPNANVLRYLGLDTKQISALEELNVFEIQVNIKNKPRIPLTKNVQKIGYEIDAFKECNKDIKDTLFFRGKTAETDNKNYKFTNEEVTYAISVNTSRVDEGETIKFSLNEMAEQIYDKMKIVYDKNIEDIKKYIEQLKESEVVKKIGKFILILTANEIMSILLKIDFVKSNHFNLITVNSVFIGFLFTSLSILMDF